MLAENERNRIGQDLHDSIGHTFVMLKLKAELAEKYLEKNNISYVEDSTNSKNDYTRNKIRNVIFPYIENEMGYN